MAASTSFFKTTGASTYVSASAAAQTRMYLGSSASAPTIDLAGEALQSGMLYTNTTDSKLYYYNGSSWVIASADTDTNTGILNVVEDLTPELGGDLASNGNDILFADSDKAKFGTGGDLEVYHNASNSIINDAGTGDLLLQTGGATKVTVQSTGASITGTAAISVNANVTGTVTAAGATIASITYPTSDGSNGQVLTTNGSGTLSLQSLPASGASVGQSIAFAIAL